MRSRTQVFIVLSIVAFAALVTVLLRRSIVRNPAYTGDGVFTDSGLLSLYPRYRVAFDAVSLTGQSRHVLRFSGVPSVQMTFSLEVIANEANHAPEARTKDPREQGTELRVRIETDSAVLVAQAHGSINDYWVLAQSSNRQVLWHPNLRDLRFSRDLAYTIVIELAKAETGTQLLTVRPALEGGGNELP